MKVSGGTQTPKMGKIPLSMPSMEMKMRLMSLKGFLLIYVLSVTG